GHGGEVGGAVGGGELGERDGSGHREGAEQRVRGAGRGGGEVQRGGVPRRGAVAELQRPQAGDGDGAAVGAFELAGEGVVVPGVVGVDVAVAEVADEQVAGERAEAGRGQGDAPGRVEHPARGHALEQAAAGVEDVDEALAHAGDGAAVAGGVLLGVGDVEPAVQVLDVEGGVSAGEVGVGKGAGEAGQVELAVDHVDLAVVEVGGVKEVPGADVTGGQPGVDGPVGRL